MDRVKIFQDYTIDTLRILVKNRGEEAPRLQVYQQLINQLEKTGMSEEEINLALTKDNID